MHYIIVSYDIDGSILIRRPIIANTDTDLQASLAYHHKHYQAERSIALKPSTNQVVGYIGEPVSN